jgi:hypothetical protein
LKIKSKFRTVSLIALLGACNLAVGSANADIFGGGPPDSGRVADNSLHNYCFDGDYPSYWVNPLTSAMVNLDNQTVMTIGVQYACNTDADVRFIKYNDTSQGAPLGLYTCIKFTIDGSRCAGSFVFLNEAKLTSTTLRQKTACHEVGHSVGLTHHYDGQYGGCMLSGYYYEHFYSSHHVAHINANY